MSYGPHSNDFLFTECKPTSPPIPPHLYHNRILNHLDGFYLDTNASETLYLDEIILQDLNASKQEELEFHQYYGYASHSLIYHHIPLTKP